MSFVAYFLASFVNFNPEIRKNIIIKMITRMTAVACY
jgi:hypothetical protein